MKIGEFSKSVNIPVKTIRYYAEIGLLNPKAVGDENKYRYYGTEQIVELNKILALKEAGFTLKEIILINKQQLPKEKFIKLLCEKLAEAKTVLTHSKNRIKNIQANIKHLKYKEDKIMKINLDELTLGPTTKNSIAHNEEGLVLKLAGDNQCFTTPCEYDLPLRINVKAKTDSTNIRLYYAYGEVIFNWECQLDELRVHDVKYGQPFGFPGLGAVPSNQFVDIVWEIRKDGMEISVDGQTRLKSSDFPYVEELKANPDLKFTSTVGIGSAWGSTVTVKELNVTEL